MLPAGLSLELRALLSAPSSFVAELADTVDASRLRPGKNGILDTVPERAVTDIRRANRWKFCDPMRLRLGSASGSGVPVREGGDPTLAPKVTPGAWGCEGARSKWACCDAESSEVGNARGAGGAGASDSVEGKAVGASEDGKEIGASVSFTGTAGGSSGAGTPSD